MDYFLMVKNDQRGPYTAQWISTALSDHTISPDTLVWREGLAGWTAAAKLPELSGYVETTKIESKPHVLRTAFITVAVVLVILFWILIHPQWWLRFPS